MLSMEQINTNPHYKTLRKREDELYEDDATIIMSAPNRYRKLLTPDGKFDQQRIVEMQRKDFPLFLNPAGINFNFALNDEVLEWDK